MPACWLSLGNLSAEYSNARWKREERGGGMSPCRELKGKGAMQTIGNVLEGGALAGATESAGRESDKNGHFLPR